MKKGLRLIWLGLFGLVLWFYPIYWITNSLWEGEDRSQKAVLEGSVTAALTLTPWSLVAILAVALIAIGVLSLVRSLLRSRH